MVKYLAQLLAGILAASCVFDADQCVMSEDQSHEIMFTVALDQQRTKATWGDSYESETEELFDIRIIPENLHVVVYGPDGNRVGVLQDLGYWPIDESHTKFQFIGRMPENFATTYNEHPDTPNYKFMVLANCGDNMSGDQYITYSQAQLNPALQNGSIPMWGVLEADVSSLINDTFLDLGEIWLLRAAAKIEVKLSENEKDKGTEINSATLKYYNQTGYVLPNGWSQVAATKLLDQENCIRLYRHAAVNLPFYKDEETGNVYVYVTEYDNINYTGERNKISLNFKINGEDKVFEDAISFCNYRDGKPLEDSHYNIVRNHIYEFEILSIAGDNLVLEYTVADWDAEQWDSDGDGVYEDYEEHDLAYPTYHNPVMPIGYLNLTGADDVNNYVIEQKPTMYFNNAHDLEAGAFECLFQITAPESVEWKPGIAGTLENYGIRVYNETKTELFFDSTDNKNLNLGACSRDSWYRIVVFPLSNDGAGSTEVDFIISYHQTWTDQYIHLYINGEYDNIRWPESGDNPKIIKIKHVAQETNVDDE